MHGNSYLWEGQCAEARAAFHQARELDPTLPYVVARLDKVERQRVIRADNQRKRRLEREQLSGRQGGRE
jgi:hypothetical protein